MADIIDEIEEREGRDKVTNDPDDSGGRTQYGISEQSHPEAWLDGKVTEPEARAIYSLEYIIEPRFHKIEFEPLRNQLIDFGVNSGQTRAVRFLQTILSVEKDGVIGPATLTALSKRNPKQINNLLVSMRKAFYYKLVEAKPSNRKFLKGWLKRADSFLVS